MACKSDVAPPVFHSDSCPQFVTALTEREQSVGRSDLPRQGIEYPSPRAVSSFETFRAQLDVVQSSHTALDGKLGSQNSIPIFATRKPSASAPELDGDAQSASLRIKSPSSSGLLSIRRSRFSGGRLSIISAPPTDDLRDSLPSPFRHVRTLPISLAKKSSTDGSISISMTVELRVAPHRIRIPHRTEASKLAISVRETETSDWEKVDEPKGLDGLSLIHFHVAKKFIRQSQLRVRLIDSKGIEMKEREALVPLHSAIGRPSEYACPLMRKGQKIGIVYTYVAPTPRKNLDLMARTSAVFVHPDAWSLDLSISHAASVLKDVRNVDVVLLRKCQSQSAVAVARKSVSRGFPANFCVYAELLRHKCCCSGSSGHLLYIEWHRGEAVVGRLQLPLNDFRLLNADDILGHCSWALRQGNGSRLAVVQNSQHEALQSSISLDLTR